MNEKKEFQKTTHMKKRKIVFSLLIACLFVFLFRSERLERFFAYRGATIEMKYFNVALKRNALKNKIAKLEFFENKNGSFTCRYISFFLEKFKVKDAKIDLVFKDSFPVNVIGIKIKGKWQVDGKYENLDVYFYFCQPVGGSYVRKDIYRKMPLDFWLKRKIDAAEVVGNSCYEIYGQFAWIENERNYSKGVLTLLITPLKQYRVKSNITDKEFVLKINSEDFPGLGFDTLKYKFFSFMQLVCAKKF